MRAFKKLSLAFPSLLLVSLIFFLGSTPLRAQVTASLTGTIHDASGAGVPQATVTVTSMETGAERTVISDSEGYYRVLSLPVGRYEMKAEKAGFKTAVQAGFDFVVGQQGVVNLSLVVGQLQQVVTVTAETPLVNITTASVSGLVGEREVKDLPLNGRSFDNLIALTTGAFAVTSLKNGGASGQLGNLFSISGRRFSASATASQPCFSRGQLICSMARIWSGDNSRRSASFTMSPNAAPAAQVSSTCFCSTELSTWGPARAILFRAESAANCWALTRCANSTW